MNIFFYCKIKIFDKLFSNFLELVELVLRKLFKKFILKFLSFVTKKYSKQFFSETGLEIKNLRFATATNDFFTKENKHYITIIMLADYISGEPKIMEPEKCEKWEWFEYDKQPSPLFLPQQNLNKQGFNPFDDKYKK